MSRRTGVLLALLLALGVGAGLAWRGIAKRNAALTAQTAAPAASPASAPGPVLDLGPADVLRLRRVDLVRTLAVSGSLKAVDTAMVKAKVAGELLTLTVREGDPVKAGQVIGQIDPTDGRSRLRQAEENAAAAQAQLEIAERTLKNNQALVDQNFISRNALETSASNAAAARANLNAARAAIDLARKSLQDAALKAPITGLVSQRLMQPGERAPLDGRIVELVDLTRLELEAAVAPEDVLGLQVGQTARLQVDGLAAPVQARVARINPSTQTGSRAVLAYLRLVDPPAGLRQGLFANGEIELGRAPRLAVPLELVRIDRARPYVLALVGNKVMRHSVMLGERGDAAFDGATPVAAVEVREGVAAGDLLLRGVVGTVSDGTPVRLAPR